MPKSWTVFKFCFTTPLHIGSEGESDEAVEDCLHSDTLFSAICHGWRELYGEGSGGGLGDLLTAFQSETPPFLLSSAFPFVTPPENKQGNSAVANRQPQEEKSQVNLDNKTGLNASDAAAGFPKTLYYLPKPLLRPPLPDDPKTRERLRQGLKLLDDLDWIEQSFFSQWIQFSALSPPILMLEGWQEIEALANTSGQPQLVHSHPILSRAVETRQHPLAVMEQLREASIKTAVRSRNQLDRVTAAARPYYVGGQIFGVGSGLYCIVQWDADQQAQWQQPFETVLKFMGERGIGGERSSHYGRYTVQGAADFHLPLPPVTASGRLSLSLCYPAARDREALEWGDVRLHQYAFIERAGWVTSPHTATKWRRQVMRMLDEGSTFQKNPTAAELQGRLVKVTPPGFFSEAGHEIYRYGLALTLPINLEF